ncbi:MAG: hypothetical protein KTR30_33000 [Saprospiraceae bacterium]|nr:hypothetical protein [Saprospiraceae bacterium]
MKKDVEERLAHFFEQQKEQDQVSRPGLSEILSRTDPKLRRKQRWQWIAASLLLALSSTSYFYYQYKMTPPESTWFRYEAEPSDQLLDWESPTDFLIP